MNIRIALSLTLLVLSTFATAAHESRPAFLQLREAAVGRYEVLWKRPARGERTLALSVDWPAPCKITTSNAATTDPDATLERGLLDCGTSDLIGRRIGIAGLPATLTATLVRVEFNDGTIQTNLAKPSDPWVLIEGPHPRFDVAADYFVLGVAHILLGFDHLLFVLGLTLLVTGWPLLLRTITAFTVAHSITLGLATLGYVTVPIAPIEAVIALSIVFLAVELVRKVEGTTSLTHRVPWVVAFVFGLLHGFGFAGALSEVGLPQGEIPLALLAFNCGVEVGQIAFVCCVLTAIAAGRQVVTSPPRWVRLAPAYAIGPVASFWLFERIAAFG